MLALSTPVYGQWGGGGRNGQGNQGQRGPMPTTQDGTVESFVMGGMRMTTKDGQAVSVLVAPATTVHLTGSATSDFLKPGLAVEFTAEVDKKHMVKEKVTSLTVVTATAEHPVGLLPEGSESVKPAEADNFGFAAGGGDGAAAAPADKGTKKAEKTEKHKSGPIQLPATVVVRGYVKSCKAGKLVVNYGHGVVKAQLDDEAQIAVNVADLSAARKGDAISVQGRALRQGFIQAESVTIQAAELLSGKAKKKTPKADQKHGQSKKDGSGDDGESPKADKKPVAD
jgi:hypothetical protein